MRRREKRRKIRVCDGGDLLDAWVWRRGGGGRWEGSVSGWINKFCLRSCA